MVDTVFVSCPRLIFLAITLPFSPKEIKMDQKVLGSFSLQKESFRKEQPWLGPLLSLSSKLCLSWGEERQLLLPGPVPTPGPTLL